MKKKDAIFLVAVSVIIITIFSIFLLVNKNTKHDFAYIYVGYGDNLVGTVDFKNQKIIINKVDSDNYPKIIDDNKIIVLSFIEIDAHKEELEIKIDFEKRSVKVIKSSCKDQICVLQGEVTTGVIICAPGRVRIDFELRDQSDIVI
ncbi:MAG: NusG domain II-containing protein [Acholeplasmatales bacterium]|nr:NusG domain II-containing protein [Acholeplasmatales bacterium]